MRLVTKSLISLCLMYHTALAYADCVPADDAPPPQSVYTGYPRIGYKGAAEYDPLWHRLVVTRHHKDSQDQYRLRTDRIWYDSLEPIDLGRATGFIAIRQGCSRLLNLRGKALPIPYFQKISRADWSDIRPGSILYALESGDLGDYTYRLVRFSKGRAVGVSNEYEGSSYTQNTLDSFRVLPRYLRFVVASSRNRTENDRRVSRDGHGLIDQYTMQEVLKPVWRGVGGIGLASHKIYYLLADNGESQTLYSPDGKTRLMENIKSIVVMPNWLPAEAGESSEKRTVIAVSSQGEDSCRLYDIHLNLLLPHAIPLAHGQCPVIANGSRPYLFANGFDGSIAVYATIGTPRPRWVGSVVGEMASGHYVTGLIIARVVTSAGTRYQVFGADGSRLNSNDFDDFRYLGCGFFQVKLEEQWLTLFHNGKTSTKRMYPFSC